MLRSIVGFEQDAQGDWVAELSCGHRQHVRHRPPFEVRSWVLDEDGRKAKVGTSRDCPLCEANVGGEPACYVHLLCDECGVILDGSPHAAGCTAGMNHLSG